MASSILANDLAGDFLRLLDSKVYVGASAGSMIFSRHLTERMVAFYGGGDELVASGQHRTIALPEQLHAGNVAPRAAGSGTLIVNSQPCPADTAQTVPSRSPQSLAGVVLAYYHERHDHDIGESAQ